MDALAPLKLKEDVKAHDFNLVTDQRRLQWRVVGGVDVLAVHGQFELIAQAVPIFIVQATL